MLSFDPVLEVRFFRTAAGREPVRDWLREMEREDRQAVGIDLMKVQLGWPLGMPLVRKLDHHLWEVRTAVKNGTARVLFTVLGSRMVLLHGFVKKSQKTPREDLALARERLRSVEGEEP